MNETSWTDTQQVLVSISDGKLGTWSDLVVELFMLLSKMEVQWVSSGCQPSLGVYRSTKERYTCESTHWDNIPMKNIVKKEHLFRETEKL